MQIAYLKVGLCSILKTTVSFQSIVQKLSESCSGLLGDLDSSIQLSHSMCTTAFVNNGYNTVDVQQQVFKWFGVNNG